MSGFAEFYLATKDAAFRAVLAAGGRRAVAEDAVAEAYTRACARWDTVGVHPDPFAWVMRTAFNWQRSWWRRTRLEKLGADIPDAPQSQVPQPEDVDTKLRELVRCLPRRQREVVALRVIADLSAERTAEILGISAATVHVHLHRALSSLRKQTELLEVV